MRTLLIAMLIVTATATQPRAAAPHNGGDPIATTFDASEASAWTGWRHFGVFVGGFLGNFTGGMAGYYSGIGLSLGCGEGMDFGSVPPFLFPDERECSLPVVWTWTAVHSSLGAALGAWAASGMGKGGTSSDFGATLAGATAGSLVTSLTMVAWLETDEEAVYILGGIFAATLPALGAYLGSWLSRGSGLPSRLTSGALLDVSSGDAPRLAVPALSVATEHRELRVSLPLLGGRF